MRRATTITLVSGLLLVLSAGAALAAFISCSGGFCEGTKGNDFMDGTSGSDEMHALKGNDTLFGNWGEDVFFAGKGNDTIEAQDGDDPGVDTASGGPGKDRITANDGFADDIDCGTGSRDIAYFDNGLDSVSGCEKLTHFCPGGLCQGTNLDDTMYGTSGSDEIHALDGDDRIAIDDDFGNGDPGVDSASGGPGNDVIAANDGFEDQVDCGTGSRDIAYFDVKDTVNSDCEWQNFYPEDRLQCTAPWVPLLANKPLWCIDGTADDDELVGTADPGVIDSIWGGAGDDTLKGFSGSDALAGWSGNDILVGGDGSDWLFGDDSERPGEIGDEATPFGEDKIYGGKGNDFIGAIDSETIDNAEKDTISCGRGRDRVQMDKGIDKAANDCEKVSYEPEPLRRWFRSLGRRH